MINNNNNNNNNKDNNDNYGFVMSKFHMHMFKCAIQLKYLKIKYPKILESYSTINSDYDNNSLENNMFFKNKTNTFFP